MKKSLLLTLATGLASGAFAQELTPVWYQHHNGSFGLTEANKFPLIKKQAGAELYAGESVYDVYVGFQKYDATRSLLGIMENGLNETDPGLTTEQQALAAAYPDRSLIWIETATGKPLGIALVMGTRPKDVTFVQEWIDKHGGEGAYTTYNDLYWGWSLDEGPDGQKVIYSGYKDKVLRWTPMANHTWSDTPTVAFQEPTPGNPPVPNESTPMSSGDRWWQWRHQNVRVTGSGNDTVIAVNANTWRPGMHIQKLTTTDGVNFLPAARVNDRDNANKNGFSFGGAPTSIIRYGKDSARPNLETVFEAHYPAAGWGPPVNRYTFDPDSPRAWSGDTTIGLFVGDEAEAGDFPKFTWDQGPADGLNAYDGYWNANLQGHKDLDYLVAYSMPSWNNAFNPDRPGWLALHTTAGQRAKGNSTVKIDCLETDESENGGQTGPFLISFGNVEVYPNASTPKAEGRSQIHWVGRTLGFGVFEAKNVAASFSSQPPATMSGYMTTTLRITADTLGGPNFYVWQKDGADLVDDARVSGSRTEKLSIRDAISEDAGKYTLLVKNPLGNLTAETVVSINDFEEINVAVNGTATASSECCGGVASRIIDGNTDGNWGGASVSHTGAENNPSFLIELAADEVVGRLELWNRTDCCGDRTRDMVFTLLDASQNVLWTHQYPGQAPNPLAINLPSGISGVRFAKVERFYPEGTVEHLNLAEYKVIRPYADTLTVNVVTSPASQSVLENTRATFGPVAGNVVAGPQDRLTYQWQRDGIDIPGATGGSYTTPLLVRADSGAKFRVRFLLSGKAVDSADATLTVTPVPTLVLTPAGANIELRFEGNLESADELAGPWAPVLGATTPHTVLKGGSSKKFYRARL